MAQNMDYLPILKRQKSFGYLITTNQLIHSTNALRDVSLFFRNFRCPIGDEDYCNNYVFNKSILTTNKIINKLHEIDDAQIEYLILKNCISFSRMNYFLRTVPPQLITQSTNNFDKLIIQAISTIIPYNINENAYQQIQLRHQVSFPQYIAD